VEKRHPNAKSNWNALFGLQTYSEDSVGSGKFYVSTDEWATEPRSVGLEKPSLDHGNLRSKLLLRVEGDLPV
jgi:hypothetical protein